MLALFVAAAAATASPRHQDLLRLVDCSKLLLASSHGQEKANSCELASFDRAENALQAQLGQLMDVLKDDAVQMKALQESQRNWLAYRLSWCAFTAWESRGKEDWTQRHYGCLAEITRRRTKDLENLLIGDDY